MFHMGVRPTSLPSMQIFAPPNGGVDPATISRGACDEHPYQFVIHDRDSIFSKDLDRGVKAVGVRVLRTPVRAPKANAVCERLGGSLRRECLDCSGQRPQT